MGFDSTEAIRGILTKTLTGYVGKVIGDGIADGLSGCVRDVAERLAMLGTKKFKLIAYLPKVLPLGNPHDERYDQFVSRLHEFLKWISPDSGR